MNGATPKHLSALSAAELEAYIDTRIPEGLVRDHVCRIVYFDVVMSKWSESGCKSDAWREWINDYITWHGKERPDDELVISALIALGWTAENARKRVIMVTV